MEDCIVYLVFQLRQGGFEVRFTYPNLLWISWKHHEAEYLVKQNPIIQAMVPEQPKTPALASLPKPQAMPKKKQLPPSYPGSEGQRPSVSFNDEIAILTGMAPQGGSMTPYDDVPRTLAGTPLLGPSGTRRAADYRPPDSFMQNMDRPVKAPQAKGNVLADLWSI